jgi:signal transduction histidine kinase/CheY-like chemotaxis protein
MPARLLLFATALLVALPAAGIIVYSGVQLRRQAMREAAEEVRRLSDTLAAHQESLVAGAQQLIHALSQLPEVRRRDAARVHDLLAGIHRLNAQYSNLFIADAAGTVWAQALDQPPFSAADRRYFKQAVASGRLSSGEYLIGRSSGKPTLTFAQPFRDARGELAGIICIGLDPGLYRRFLPPSALAGGMNYLLLDHRGVVIARGSDEARFVGRPFPPVLFEGALGGNEGEVATTVSMAGDERLVSRRRLWLPGEDRPYLLVLTSVPTAGLRAGADRATLRDVGLLLLVLFAAASLAWLLGERSIAGPLRRLESATRRVAGGDLQVRVAGAPGSREVEALARSVDDMARQLDERERARRHSEQLYLQSQKMESVGRLAGGIAHDFNNLLTVINGHCALLRDTLTDRPDALEDLEVIRSAGESAGSLTRQLLAFSRKQLLQPRVVDLNLLLAGTDRMLRRVLGEDVRLVTHLAPGLWPIRADPGQVEQVVMNLAVNARDAMPRGGTLTLETANVLLPPGGEGPRSAGDEDHVLLAVSDTGEGMDAATLERLFEPFFTTKNERGTGLGLSTVYGIVTQSGGRVAVESAPGRGTVFRVHFPRERDVVAPPPGVERSAADPGTRTILVAEDSDPVRALMRDVLELRGHRVLDARSGEEAVALSEQHAGPIDLLLADVVMPGMSGRELAERLGASRPELRVLYVTGYTDDRILTEGLLQARIDLLEKPFTPDALLWKIGEVLGRRTA